MYEWTKKLNYSRDNRRQKNRIEDVDKGG